jgi:dihydropteroate synthase
MFVKKVKNIEEAKRALKALGADPRGVAIMSRKMVLHVIELKDLDIRAANILKQECLSCGAELALPKEACKLKVKKTDAILIANKKQFDKLKGKLLSQPFGLKAISQQVSKLLENFSKSHGKPRIMGILNVTPDSFSDGGKFFDSKKATDHALQMIKDGANIIDVGGESTGPGSKNVTAAEEIKRVIPVIKAIRKKNKRVTISIDTYKAKVAEAALKAGANMVNDVTALRGDKQMAKLVAKTGTPIILMYSKDKTPRTTKRKVHYANVVQHIVEFLKEQTEFAIKNGIKPEQIIIDPGMGAFVSTEPSYSLEILHRLEEFKLLGYPILLGPSRKSFIPGKLEDRLPGTIAACTIALQNGANILRVHDVAECKQIIEVV